MIKTERTVYCDACGRVISDYQSHRHIRQYADESIHWEDEAEYDFCRDCTIAFKEWCASRKIDKKVGDNDGKDD